MRWENWLSHENPLPFGTNEPHSTFWESLMSQPSGWLFHLLKTRFENAGRGGISGLLIVITNVVIAIPTVGNIGAWVLPVLAVRHALELSLYRAH
jgi:hypothetical protein